MMKTMLHSSIDDRDLFLRKEIARGRSGRLIVHELVRLGYCDVDKARDLVSREGPAVYASLSRRYGLLFMVGMILLMTMIMALFAPVSPVRTGGFYVLSLIAAPILTIVGYAGIRRYRSWNFEVDEVDGRTSRLEGLAREMLNRGKGEWAIVHEAGKLRLGDPDAARAVVARVWPDVYRDFAARRRSTFMFGLFILGIGLAPVVAMIGSVVIEGRWDRAFRDIGGILFLMSIPIAVGSIMMARGWTRRRSDAPIGLPGTADVGPVRTGLGWNASPFERQ